MGFSATCPNCHLAVTKEAMGVRRLAEDMQAIGHVTSSRLWSVHLAMASVDYPPLCSSSLTSSISGLPHPFVGLSMRANSFPSAVGTKWKWTRQYAAKDTLLSINAPAQGLKRALSAYVGAERASVDLVPAVSDKQASSGTLFLILFFLGA